MKSLIKQLPFLPLIFLFGIFLQCESDLSVNNLNEPDRDRVLSIQCETENYLGSTFRDYWSRLTGNTPSFALSTIADELSSSWCNGTRDNSSEPRVAWDNSPSYPYKNVSLYPWRGTYKSISAVNDVLYLNKKGMTFVDDVGIDQTNRNIASANFIHGISYGLLGLVFDKAVVIDENTDLGSGNIVLTPYDQLINIAVEKLNECINLSNSNSFDIPESWWPGNHFNQDDLSKLANSYAARFLACKARTPEERAAADWVLIKNYAQNGINKDFGIYCDGENWWSGIHGLASSNTWCRADYKLIGPADTSGNYQNWLETPVHERNHIFIHTDDQRITGSDSISDGSCFAYYGRSPFRADRGTYHFSYYHCKRFLDYYKAGYVGYAPIFSVAENNLLQAEAELRLGNSQGAADIINLTRVSEGGLTPATTSNIGDPSDHRYVHGSLWAMLKYEKGIETCQKNVGVAWFDRRGWGELPKGTILHFPIPGSELELMMLPNYSFGGYGGAGSAQ